MSGSGPPDPASKAAQLLRQFEILATRDEAEARHFIGGTLSPHSQTVLAGTLDVRMHLMALPAVGVALLDYGAHVRVETRLQTWFGAIRPLQGEMRVTSPSGSVVVTPQHATILSPSEQLTLEFAPGCTLMIVKMDRVAVERAAVKLLSRPLREPLVFDLAMDPGKPRAATFWNIAAMLVGELARPGTGLKDAPVATQVELLMINALLNAQPFDLVATPTEKTRIAPRHVKLAEAYMFAHADEEIDLDALCGAAGVSRRTLYSGFRQHRGTSPMSYLKDIRLERVRQALLNARPDETVTQLAMQFGFQQLGRFAVDYRKRFGESPSDTLRFGKASRSDSQ